MKYKVWRQYLVPHHLFSRAMGWFTTRTWPWLKDWQIRTFVNVYQVDLSNAEHNQTKDYVNFTHFFTRKLQANARPVCEGRRDIASPADGKIAQLGLIEGNRLLQAKKHFFTLEELLGGNHEHAALFQDGSFATIYLAPKDYHRVHMPITGRLTEMIYIPGRLFSVNALTSEHVPRLFARNERVVCLFETQAGPMAVILVGAMFVASICTTWAGTVTPHHSRTIYTERYQQCTPIILKRGEELGFFNFGSTVILLFPKDRAQWLSTLSVGNEVCMGQRLGEAFIDN